MKMFQCDYTQGAHPKVMEALVRTNFEQTVGYGEDPYCARAAEIIRTLCDAPDADVHLLVGGTQTNTTVIKAALRPHQGVICADTGHINVHESGAIESIGHKVLPLPSFDGKISAEQIRKAVAGHFGDCNHEHMVQPGMVYISHPTEVGTLYTLAELEAVSGVCREYSIPLFVDGARLGYGVMAPGADVTLRDIARLSSVFYIGGTKCGALFGEAVVITAPELKKDFRYLVKQQGGMLAKGRLLGVQFISLLEDGLYWEITGRADDLACRIRSALAEKGYPVLYESATNQQFPIFSDNDLRILQEKYMFDFWEKPDSCHTAVRICTSWATTEEDTDELIADIKAL